MTRIVSGGALNLPEDTLASVFSRTVKAHGNRAAFRTRRNGGTEFEDIPYTEAGKLVADTANGLLSLGMKHGERAAILADTSYQWMVSDYAILATSGVTVTVYPTLTADQIAYLLNDSGSRFIFIDSQVQLDKLKSVASTCKSLEGVITLFDGADAGDLGKMTHSWKDFMADGESWGKANPTALEERTNATKPDDIATIVYTSGTTGVPKGAVITHKNFVAAYKSGAQTLRVHDGALTLALLPLAHCYQRMVCFLAVDLHGTIMFTTPPTLTADLPVLQPELMAAVPRLYERMYDGVLRAVDTAPPARQKIFHWAANVARDYGRAISNGGKPTGMQSFLHGIGDKLVYSKLREKLGASRMTHVVTGSAAIRPDLLYFFRGIGIPIIEGYGLTETAAPSNVNLHDKFKPGMVGPPLPGMQQKLAEDGEVLMKGPHIFQGYYNLESETKECFTADGWFCTGDIGVFDEDGFLKIVDRKKELEVLTTGKKIAPITVEEKLKVSKYVSDVCLTGTDQNVIGALIQPNFERLLSWADQNKIPYDQSKVSREKDPTGAVQVIAVGEDLTTNAKVLALFQGEVDTCNKELADFERIRVFRLVPNAFSIARDELTPTFKKKRRVIKAAYEGMIADMYTRK